MNVIVSNELQSKLANIDVDIIKSINGSFEASELIEMFKDFFYSKMILDVTAIKQYKELRSYEELVKGLDADKIIFVFTLFILSEILFTKLVILLVLHWFHCFLTLLSDFIFSLISPVIPVAFEKFCSDISP